MTCDEPARVREGSKVRVRAWDGESVLTIRDRHAPDPFTVDPNSPLGKALMGRCAGETVEVVLAKSLPTRKVTILAVE